MSGLVTTTVLNTKNSENENKIPNTRGLVTTTALNTKISKVKNKIPNHDKYITISEFNKITAEDFTARLKQANLVTKTNFEKKLTSFNKKITSNKTKYLEVQKKLNNLITSNDRSQNTFVYQPTLDTLKLKKGKGTDYVLSWKSNGVYNSRIKPLHTTLFNSIKRSGYKMGIKFGKTPLAVE